MKLKPQASGARGLFAFVVLSAVPLGASERDAVKAAVHPVCKTSTAKQWAHVPSRYRAWGTVFDPVRQRVVAFAKPLEPGREFVAVEWTGAGWSPFVPRSGSPVGDRPDGAIALNPGGSGFMVFAENGVTWVWDGEQWDEHFGLGPRGRTPAALVYDSNRDKVLLFGGRRESDHSQYFDDTWQWDGARWERVFSADSPSPRDAAWVGYDAKRKRVVLFGGRAAQGAWLADTWEWDGERWTNAFPWTSPGPRVDAMAYDPVRQGVVLVGYKKDAPYWTGTWIYDGEDWRVATEQLPALGRCRSASDPVAGRLVLACATQGDVEETWESDGTKWVARESVPPATADSAVATDLARGRVLLFIGGEADHQTWEWDGKSWERHRPPVQPDAQYEFAMAYNPDRKRVVLFGGLAGGCEPGMQDCTRYAKTQSSMWEWDGRKWEKVVAASRGLKPAPRSGHALAYDSRRKRLVVHGGRLTGSGGAVASTWEWGGAKWEWRTSESPPSVTSMHSDMAYDAERGRMMLQLDCSTYEWGQKGWDKVASAERATSFVSESCGNIVFDRRRRRVVLYDGETLWVWDGKKWDTSDPVAKNPDAFGWSRMLVPDVASEGVAAVASGTVWADCRPD